MEPADESISVRAMRLAGALDGPSIMASTSLYKELLFDAVALLFDECNNECMKNNDRVSRFVDKCKCLVADHPLIRIPTHLPFDRTTGKRWMSARSELTAFTVRAGTGSAHVFDVQNAHALFYPSRVAYERRAL